MVLLQPAASQYLRGFMMRTYDNRDIVLQQTLFNAIPNPLATAASFPMPKTQRDTWFPTVSVSMVNAYSAHIRDMPPSYYFRAGMILNDIMRAVVRASGANVDLLKDPTSTEFNAFAACMAQVITDSWLMRGDITPASLVSRFRELYVYSTDYQPAVDYLNCALIPDGSALIDFQRGGDDAKAVDPVRGMDAGAKAAKLELSKSGAAFPTMVRQGTVRPLRDTIPSDDASRGGLADAAVMNMGKRSDAKLFWPWTEIKTEEDAESHDKPFPDTLAGVVNYNAFLGAEGWWLRVITRLMAATAGAGKEAYDARPNFVNHCYFPVIMRREDGNYYGMNIPAVYSSGPLNDMVLRHRQGYTTIAVDAMTTVNIDSPAIHAQNPDAIKSIVAALIHTRPRNMSYISFLTSVPLTGPSMGLAVALAVLGAPPLSATGFIYGSDLMMVDDTVRDVQLLEAKFKLARRENWPIITSHQSIMRTLMENRGTGYESTIYTSAMMMAGTVDSRFQPGRHLFLAATSLPEAAMMACMAWYAGSQQMVGQEQDMQRRSLLTQMEASSRQHADDGSFRAAGLVDIDSKRIVEDDGKGNNKKGGGKKKATKRYR